MWCCIGWKKDVHDLHKSDLGDGLDIYYINEGDENTVYTNRYRPA